MRSFYHALGILVFLAGSAFGQESQGAWDTRRDYTTRSQLEALVLRLDSTSRRGRDNESVNELALVRKRLVDGDFQSGDRVFLIVEGEQVLSDTFTVDDGRSITLPNLGVISLHGVLRAELEDSMRAKLSFYIRDPVIHARALIRIAVLGEVNRPGYYLVPPGSQIEDVLMTAGGPTRDSNVRGMTIQRTDGQSWSSDDIHRAIADGRTLDQLGIRSGDQLVMPRHHAMGQTIMLFSAIVTTVLAIATLAHIHP